jgi:hypothetical protein
MGDVPKTPNLDDPKTKEDFDALAALRKAQADALDAQAKLIASQQALQKAQGSDLGAAQLAAATQAASIAAQQKALADSQAATLKDKFAVPDSGITGEVKTTNAGSFEASLLAASAVSSAASHIAAALAATRNNEMPDVLVVYGSSDLPDFQSLITYRAQFTVLDRAMLDAIVKIQQAEKAAPAPPAPPAAAPEFAPAAAAAGLAAVTPVEIGAALEAANKILGYFRSDYSVQGVTVTADERLLTEALAGAFAECGKRVFVPSLYNAQALEGSPIVSELIDLATKRAKLQQAVNQASNLSDALMTRAAAEPDPTKKKVLTDAAGALKAAADQGKSIGGMYDALLTKLTASDDKSKTPLAVIIQQEAVHRILRGGALLLTAKISSAGGTAYTQRNLWRFFWGMPFYVMGGAVVTYSVFDGVDGGVVLAGSVPVDSGFFNVEDVARQFVIRPPKAQR